MVGGLGGRIIGENDECLSKMVDEFTISPLFGDIFAPKNGTPHINRPFVEAMGCLGGVPIHNGQADPARIIP